MKKILIASACALTLCLTSCASKKPQETAPQLEAPEAEVTENTEQTPQEETDQNSEESENQTDSENQNDETTEETADTEAAEEAAAVTSEDFPEPEVFEEPEIITLEPQDELPPEEEESEPEQVEQEEPPVIVVTDETLPTDNFAALPDSTETAENAESETEEENEDDIISVASDTDEVTTIGNGIDITDDDSDSGEEYSEKEAVIIPSRSVTLKKFEYLEVSYPGTGWIYMGLTDNSKDLAYFGRKLGTKDTQFSLQARAAGTKIVHFYRNDPLTGNYLDDYIEVIILAENGSNKTHIKAPEYKLPVQKKEVPEEKTEEQPETEAAAEESKAETKTETKPAETKTNTAAASKNATDAKTSTTAAKTTENKAASTAETKTATNATTSTSEVSETEETVTTTQTVSDPSSLLKEAQVLYNEKEYAAALNKLNQFFEYSTDNRDEALYLKGQILEAKSDVRDIKGAMDAYTSLTKNYPASKLWDSANKRIIYLKRFYLEVR